MAWSQHNDRRSIQPIRMDAKNIEEMKRGRRVNAPTDPTTSGKPDAPDLAAILATSGHRRKRGRGKWLAIECGGPFAIPKRLVGLNANAGILLPPAIKLL